MNDCKHASRDWHIVEIVGERPEDIVRACGKLPNDGSVLSSILGRAVEWERKNVHVAPTDGRKERTPVGLSVRRRENYSDRIVCRRVDRRERQSAEGVLRSRDNGQRK